MLKPSVKYMSFLGIYSQYSTEPTNTFWKTIRVYVFLFIFLGLFECGSLIFIVRNYGDFDSTINAFMVLSGAHASFGSFLSIGLNMKKVQRLINEYQVLTNDGK